MKYGIGFVIDNQTNSQRLRTRIAAAIGSTVVVTLTGVDAGTGETFEYTERRLVGHPGILVDLGAAVNSKYTGSMRQEVRDQITYLIEFGPSTADYDIAEVRQRLYNLLREAGCDKVWLVDHDTDTSGDLLSKFV
jgi:hypothetical protein